MKYIDAINQYFDNEGFERIESLPESGIVGVAYMECMDEGDPLYGHSLSTECDTGNDELIHKIDGEDVCHEPIDPDSLSEYTFEDVICSCLEAAHGRYGY